MKSERRHELQKNDLALWLESRLEEIKPFATHIAVGALVLVVLIAVFSYLAGRTGETPAAWADYYEALGTPEPDQRISELRRVTEDEKFAGTAAQSWARLSLGEARLQRGSSAAFKDRAAGEEDIESARDDFQAVIDKVASLSAGDTDMLHRRAVYGLAQALESLGDADKAREQYALIAKTWPESALGKVATKRTATLNDMSSWYDWYASAELPTPSARFQPPGGSGVGSGFTPPKPPQLFDDLPDTDDPDFTLPGPLDGPGTGSTSGGSDAGSSFEDLFNDEPADGTGDDTKPTPDPTEGDGDATDTGGTTETDLEDLFDDDPSDLTGEGGASTEGDAETAEPGDAGVQDEADEAN